MLKKQLKTQKKIFNSNNVEVEHFQKRNERIINSNDNQKIYINNLPEKCPKEELNKLCSNYVKVEDFNIFVDNVCKNFGIVQFSSDTEAKNAINELKDKEINGNILNCRTFQNQYEHRQYLQNNTKRINDKILIVT